MMFASSCLKSLLLQENEETAPDRASGNFGEYYIFRRIFNSSTLQSFTNYG